MNKYFEKLCEYLSHVKGNFSIIALTEKWYCDDKANKTSLWRLPIKQQYIELYMFIIALIIKCLKVKISTIMT